MNREITKVIIASILIVLFLLPLTVMAETSSNYEKNPKFSNEELAQILAPIALYPDSLLSQILIAASYPFEVAEAERWIAKNPYLTDEQLDNSLQSKDWDVSILSLCYYPNILAMMAENLTWTAKIGNAFVHQQQDVMDTIQELRAMAKDQGNLATTNEQRVIVEEKIIRIEPAYYNCLYVPVYDPFFIYGRWCYPNFPPFRIFYPGVRVVGPGIAFSSGIFIGSGFIGWSVFDWPSHNVVILNIGRTKRFNRHYHLYHHNHYRAYWKPNHHKRMGHLLPAKKSHTVHTPARKHYKKVLRPKPPPKPLAAPQSAVKGRPPSGNLKSNDKHSAHPGDRHYTKDRHGPHNQIKPHKQDAPHKGKQTSNNQRVPNRVKAPPKQPHSNNNVARAALHGEDHRNLNNHRRFSSSKGREGMHRAENHSYTGRSRTADKYRR
jgi:hypothetical protein